MKLDQIKFPVYILTALFAAMPVIIAGCDLPGEVPLTNFDDVTGYFKEVMINDEFFSSEEGILNDGETYDIAKVSAQTNDEPIFPRRFGRIIHSIERTFQYEPQNDSIFVVTMTRTITGDFRILYATSVLGAANDVVNKPFIEENVRKARFLKVADTGVPESDWKLVALSLLEGGTKERSFSIQSLTVHFRGDENPRTFTDPLAQFFRIGYGMRNIPRVDYDPGTILRTGIEVKLISENSEREIVFLRQGGGQSIVDFAGNTRALFAARERMAFQSEIDLGNGLFERTYAIQWVPGILRGRLCMLAEVMSRGTLFDLDEEVESHYWGVPFVVE
jgi:hypothetical protein